jgi:hypothetical protein
MAVTSYYLSTPTFSMELLFGVVSNLNISFSRSWLGRWRRREMIEEVTAQKMRRWSAPKPIYPVT